MLDVAQRVTSKEALRSGSAFGMQLTVTELRQLVPLEPRVRSELPVWRSPICWRVEFDLDLRVVKGMLQSGGGACLGFLDPWSPDDDHVIRRQASTTQRAVTWVTSGAGQDALNEVWVNRLACDADPTDLDDHVRRVRGLLHDAQWCPSQ